MYIALGVKFTLIVDVKILLLTMGVKFIPIVSDRISTSTMRVKFTPIVDDIAYFGAEEVILCYPEMLYPV